MLQRKNTASAHSHEWADAVKGLTLVSGATYGVDNGWPQFAQNAPIGVT